MTPSPYKKKQGVRAIAIACFISCSEEETTVRHLRFMDALFSGNSEGLEASDELKVSDFDRQGMSHYNC